MRKPPSYDPTVQITQCMLTRSALNRRVDANGEALRELSDSIKKHGILQPLLVREQRAPGENQGEYKITGYEIIAGERRFHAAIKAGLSALPCKVIDCSDEEAVEIMIIENLHRKDLHPLDEARGYAELIKLKYSASKIASEIGKSESYIAKRIKLNELAEPAKKLFKDGKIALSAALAVARIPDDRLQEKAADEIAANSWMRAGDNARKHVVEKFMVRLKDAWFKLDDRKLVEDAGPCTECDKQTDKAPRLFDDIGKDAHCTDPACYRRKVKSLRKRLVAHAKSTGVDLLDGDRAKNVLQGEGMGWNSIYTIISGKCQYSDNGMLWSKVLAGQEIQRCAIITSRGRWLDLALSKDVARVLRKLGFKKLPSVYEPSQQQAVATETPAQKEKQERAAYIARAEREIFCTAVGECAEKAKLEHDHMRILAETVADRYYRDTAPIRKRLGVRNLRGFAWKGSPSKVLSMCMEMIARSGELDKPLLKTFKLDPRAITKQAATEYDLLKKAAEKKVKPKAKPAKGKKK